MATEYEIGGKRLVIAGRQGSGKTQLARHLAGLFDPARLTVYDPMRQFLGKPFEGAGVYHPKDTRSRTEFDAWLRHTLPPKGRRSSKYDCVIVDESNIFMPMGRRLTPAMDSHVSLGRHFGTTLICVTRRLQQLHTDVVELADYLVTFRLRGANASRRLNEESPGLGIEARGLPPYHYAVSDGDGYTVHSPVPLGATA